MFKVNNKDTRDEVTETCKSTDFTHYSGVSILFYSCVSTMARPAAISVADF